MSSRTGYTKVPAHASAPAQSVIAAHLPDDLEMGLGVVAATSKLQEHAAEVRSNRVHWSSYHISNMINDVDFKTISTFEIPEERVKLLRDNPHQVVRTFLHLISQMSKDQTVQYLLTLIDDMLQEDKSRVELFREYSKKQKEPVWRVWMNMLTRSDGFIVNQTSRIIAKMACWSKEQLEGSDLHYYLTWLKEQLKLPGNEYMQTVARCLQMMLRIDEYRFAFVGVDGITTIITVLEMSKVNFQIQYQLIFCLWCLSFNPQLADKLSTYRVIPALADILSQSVKEKVTRIILATFRNLLEKPDESGRREENALSMVLCKVLKSLSMLENNKYDDEDIIEDITFINEQLQASVQDLSSFDEYSSELKSGRLEWSPVHKSEKFWRENVMRLNEKNYELLKILIKLLECSKDSLVIGVAAHDIGEYVRHYPRGKNIIEQLGGKQLVMQYLTHDDPNVRYQALLAVQKLMVHNWEYLGKQLQHIDDQQQSGGAAAVTR